MRTFAPAMKGRARRGAILALCVSCGFAGTAIGQDAPEKKAETGLAFHGFFRTTYKLRWTDSTSDQDLYETLGLDIGDAERDSITGHMMLRASEDLDGRQATTGAYAFDSLQDSYTRAIQAKLDYAYADFHSIEGLARLRAGRQYLYDTPVPAYFDGGYAESSPNGAMKLQFGAFAGVPVNLYESSPSGDYTFGTFAQSRPWRGGRVRFDWMHEQDKRSGATNRDDLYGLGVWQRAGESLDFFVRHTRLESDPRDLQLRGTFTDPGSDFTVQANYTRLFKTQVSLATQFDTFFQTALEYFPYQQGQIVFSKGLGNEIFALAGVDVRRLVHESDEGDFNREFERYYLTLNFQKLPLEGVTASLTGEIWDSSRDIKTAGADITKTFSEAWKASVGTYFALYKFDDSTLTERDRVRDYYVKIENRRSKDTKWILSYDYENDQFDQYHKLKLEFRCGF